jgi:transposase
VGVEKGRRYGTILVDLERHCVIDILPDDAVATVRDWLTGHPDIDLIARDRANAFADAARQGAPAAVQIADRFHLLMNLRVAVQRLLERHRSCLPTERQIADHPAEASGDLSTRYAIQKPRLSR